MIDLIIAVLIVVTIKHFFKSKSINQSINQLELIEATESRSEFRARSKIR